MVFVTDLHTHTVASGHAYNTLDEMARAASEKGVELIATTDHSPGLPGGAHEFHFFNLKILPDYIYNVRVLKGSEVNVINEDGEIDIDERFIENLEYIAAALHTPVIKPVSSKVNTRAAVNAMKNPLINTLAHPDDVRYDFDYDTLVKAAVDTNTFIEFNSHSLECGRGTVDSFKRLYESVVKYDAKIVFGSDAHYKTKIADFDAQWEMLKGYGEDGSRIVNLTTDSILDALGL